MSFGFLKKLTLTFAITAASASVFALDYDGIIKNSYMTVRKEAKFNSAIVGKKMRGDIYHTIYENRNWIKAQFPDGVVGWLFKTISVKSENASAPYEVAVASDAADINAETEVKPLEKKEESKKPESEKKDTEKKAEKPVEKSIENSAKKKAAPAAKEAIIIKPDSKETAVAEFSGSAEDLYNEAITLYGERRYEDALERNLLAAKKAPKNAEIVNNIGNCLFKLNRTDEALSQWRKALRLAPKSGKICNNIGIAYYQTDRTKKAIEYYKKAIVFEPDYADSYYNLGSAYGYIGDFENAVKYFKAFNEHTDSETMKKLATDRIDYCSKQLEK